MSEMFSRLAAPFDPAVVSWRPGSTTQDKTKAKALAYIDARDVMRRLDEVVGPANWQCRYVPMPNGTTCCEIGIRVTVEPVEWVWKSNGAEMITDSNNPDMREMAIKGGYSDAFKRAAVLWGIGQYLYDVDAPWVRINKYKQIEPDELKRLQALLRGEKQKSAYQARKEGGDSDFQRIERDLRACKTIKELQDVWKREQDTLRGWPDNWQDALTAEKDRIKADLMKKAA